MTEISRAALRKSMRIQRQTLTRQTVRERSDALSRHLIRSPLFLRSQHIALYLPNDGEMDLTPVIERAWSMGKQCYLPVLSPLYHNRLWFAPYQPKTPLSMNRFGIPEPDHNWRAMRACWSLDLVMTPLVAFDNRGNRLGMGGGYYDRTLAYLNRRTVWKKPHLIGVAYEFQRYPALPFEPWDVPLHGVVTEAGWYAGGG